MENRISLRETLAWVTLVIALVLLGISVTFAQTKSVEVNNDNGNVRIKIDQTENGKTTHWDTTFASGKEEELDKIIEGLTSDMNSRVDSDKKEDQCGMRKSKSKSFVFDLAIPESKEIDLKSINRDLHSAMESLEEELDEMKNSLSDMHVYIRKFDDGDKEIQKEFGSEPGFSSPGPGFDDAAFDNLDDENHIIIKAKPGEKPPVLEKVIKSSNGEDYFIFKRGKSDLEGGKNDADPNILKIFPNPSSGRFTVEFNANNRADLTLRVFDSGNKEIYKESVDDFEGKFSKEILLFKQNKGSYLVKVTHGKKTLTGKIIIN